MIDAVETGNSGGRGGYLASRSYMIYDVEFEFTLEESGDLKARKGKFYTLSFWHPSKEPWGILVQLFNDKGKEEKRFFVPFVKDGEYVYAK